MAKAIRKDLTIGKPWQVILKLSIPLFFTSLLSLAFTTVDTIIIGQLMPQRHAGVADANSVYSFMVFISTATCMGFGAVTGNYAGKGNQEDIRKSFVRSCIYGFLIAAFIGLAFLLAIDPFLAFLLGSKETDPTTFETAKFYFMALLIGYPITMLNNLMIEQLRSFGETKRTLMFSIVSSSANILITFLLVKFLPGIYGVIGAAVGTIGSQLISIIIQAFFIKKQYSYIKLKRGDIKFSDSLSKELVTSAGPLIFQWLLIAIAQLCVSSAIISFDKGVFIPPSYTEPATYVQDANGVSSKIKSFSYLIFSAISGSMLYFTSQNNGAGRLDRVKQACKEVAFIIPVAYVLQLAMCFLLTFKGGIINLFLGKEKIFPETIQDVHIMVMAYSFYMLFKATHDTYSKTLVAMKHNWVVFITSVFELLFRFLVIFGLRYWCFQDPGCKSAFILVVCAEPMSWIISASISSIATYKLVFKNNKTE